MWYELVALIFGVSVATTGLFVVCFWIIDRVKGGDIDG